MIARALRERLPRVAEVFASGAISYRLVNAIVYRTALITDADARGQGRHRVGRRSGAGWGPLSVAKDRGRPSTTGWTAMIRTRCAGSSSAPGAAMSTWSPTQTGSGAVVDRRRAVRATTPPRWISGWMRWRARCAPADPRTLEQRRADALGALAHGGDRLACACAVARSALRPISLCPLRRWCTSIAEQAQSGR